MKEFVEFLVKQIVTKPDEVEVTETEEYGMKTVKLKVSIEDMGVIIGKEGKTIKGLRNLVRSKAIRDGVRVNLELIDLGPKPSEHSKEPETSPTGEPVEE